MASSRSKPKAKADAAAKEEAEAAKAAEVVEAAMEVPVDPLADYFGKPKPGHRGFRSMAPPPAGCVGWGSSGAAVDGTSNGNPGEVAADAPFQGKAADAPVRGKTADAPVQGKTTVQAKGAAPPQDPKAQEVQELDGADWPPSSDVFLNTSPTNAEAMQELVSFVRQGGRCTGDRAKMMADGQFVKAATAGDLESLKEQDPLLKSVLAADESPFKEGERDAAILKLVCATAASMDEAPKQRKAFQAVMRDDGEALKELLLVGRVPRDARNAAGQTLLEVAQERQRFACMELLQLPDAQLSAGPEKEEQAKKDKEEEEKEKKPGSREKTSKSRARRAA